MGHMNNSVLIVILFENTIRNCNTVFESAIVCALIPDFLLLFRVSRLANFNSLACVFFLTYLTQPWLLGVVIPENYTNCVSKFNGESFYCCKV